MTAVVEGDNDEHLSQNCGSESRNKAEPTELSPGDGSGMLACMCNHSYLLSASNGIFYVLFTITLLKRCCFHLGNQSTERLRNLQGPHSRWLNSKACIPLDPRVSGLGLRRRPFISETE